MDDFRNKEKISWKFFVKTTNAFSKKFRLYKDYKTLINNEKVVVWFHLITTVGTICNLWKLGTVNLMGNILW